VVPAAPLFVDTNVFLRLLTGDNADMQAECFQLFARAGAGDVRLWTSQLVLAELAWTLRSLYHLPRPEIARTLRGVLDLPGLSLEPRALLHAAVDLLESRNIGFADAVFAAEIQARGESQICSYDRDFEMPGIERIHPRRVLENLDAE
jgi:predicted nucleic acid-binding protein